jgi:hypothetical protein
MLDLIYNIMSKVLRKIVVIGDIHGRDVWNTIVDQNADADLFVFLGDYVSTHEGISDEDQLNNFFDILQYKEDNPDRVILLRGNHDMQHLGYYWAECSGFFRRVARELCKPEVRERYLRDTQWVYVYNNIVFSHAGISQRWFSDAGVATVEDINTLEPSELFGFRPCKMSDYYGISETQGPTWIRPQTLIEYALPDWTQVVGHTTAKCIFNVREAVIKQYGEEFVDKNAPDILICDTLPREYLIIEDGEFKPTKL